ERMKRLGVLQPSEGQRGRVRQPVPDLLVQLDPPVSARVTAEASRDLEQREFAGPGGEAGVAAKLWKLSEDRHRRVARGLVTQVVHFLPPSLRQAGAPPGGL